VTSALAVRVRVAHTSLLLDAHEGEDLLEVLQRGGYAVATACGGVASCGLCRVDVLSGIEALSAPRPHEAVHLSSPEHRLACQARIRPQPMPRDVLVRVPEPVDPATLE
jgi:ferredoxin